MKPGLGIYAAHQGGNGWTIVALSSDPRLPAYWPVMVLDQYGQAHGCGHDGTSDAVFWRGLPI
jgi:hypothetical protein